VLIWLVAKGEALTLAKAPKPDFLNAVSDVRGISLSGVCEDPEGDFGGMVAKGEVDEILEKPLPG